MPIRQYIVNCYKCKIEQLRPTSRKFLCGSCKLPNKIYPRSFYYNKKKSLVRDLGRCQCCGKKEELVTHHLDCNKQNSSISNLITLCKSCHLSLHHRYTKAQLRCSIIYNLFPDLFKWAEKRKKTREDGIKKLQEMIPGKQPKYFINTKYKSK